MTNDRAVEIMKAIIFILKNDDYSDEVEEAIHMAISALTAQEQLANDSPELDNKFGDLISRAAAIKMCREPRMRNADCSDFEMEIMMLPSARTKLDKEKISNLLWNEYRQMSSHLSAEGVVARRYFCKELWKELFGEEETPVWMTW